MPESWPAPDRLSGPETIGRLPADPKETSQETPFSEATGSYDSNGRSNPATPSTARAGSSYYENAYVEITPGEILFEKYRVLESLGEGGMGEVWLVEDLANSTKWALKTITPTHANDGGARARLANEAKAMGKFNHPNVPIVHEAKVDLRNIAFIVMEYIRGDSLHKLLRPGVPMSLDWTIEILGQLCDALQEAHNHAIIHRDLKPSNMILVKSGKSRILKVLDFGIAKMQGANELPEDYRTQVGAFIGTPPYASPEQANGYALPASDIYSVGVILYEMLTGSRPFQGKPEVLINCTKFRQPPPFSEVNPEAKVPTEIENLVLRCLEKDPDKRPISPLALFEEFQDAVNRSLEEEVAPKLKPEPETKVEEVKKSIRIHRRTLAISVMIVGVLATLGLVAAVIFNSTKHESKGKPPVAPESITHDGRPFILWHDDIYLPSGFKAVDESDLVEGYPRQITRDDVIFVRIPGCKSFGFQGTTRQSEKSEAGSSPLPLSPHRTKIEGFYLQQSEVTNGEFLDFYKEGSKERDEPWFKDCYKQTLMSLLNDEKQAAKHPVREVAWNHADSYARAKGCWLPTEDQWEYAARSRDEKQRTVWNVEKFKEKNPRDLANLRDKNDPYTIIGPYLEDQTIDKIDNMAGNVREWCRDLVFASDDPLPHRAIRGGSYIASHDDGDLLIRDLGPVSGYPDGDVGFRLVIECPPRVSH